MKHTASQSGKLLTSNTIKDVINVCFTSCRSKDFRPSYFRLGEIRALVSYTTPYMACTATATSRVRKEIIESLEMEGCVDVSVSPDRPNIFYETKLRTDIDSNFLDLESLCTLRR